MYKELLINAKMKTGKEGQETELTGSSPLGRQRSTLDCTEVLISPWPGQEGTKLQQQKILSFIYPTRVGTLIVVTIYLQLIQNRYMF